MPAKALFAVHLNVRDHDQARQFYEMIGFEEDIGYRLRDGQSHSAAWYEALGVDAEGPLQTTALHWPSDPYMHLIIHEWREPKVGGFPATWDRLGNAGLSLLVEDVEAELKAIDAAGMLTQVTKTESVGSRAGEMTAAVVKDPEGNLCELVAIEYGPAFSTEDLSRPGVPKHYVPNWDPRDKNSHRADRSWLHFELNALGENLDELVAFYERFGFEDDQGVQAREGTKGFDLENLASQYLEAYGFDMFASAAGNVWFGRLPGDPSNAHLEIWPWKKLEESAAIPGFLDRGIVRHCHTVKDLAAIEDEFRHRGVPVHMETQWGELNWGDSNWIYFADPDGNLLCFEEIHPPRLLSGKS